MDTDFITTPSDALVNISEFESEVTSGDFECATRSGYLPLWLINGLSIDLIQNLAGYSGTYTELLPLQENHVLSFLSIPASPLTNNSVIVCAAITVESVIVAYSDSVNMVVHQGIVIASNSQIGSLHY